MFEEQGSGRRQVYNLLPMVQALWRGTTAKGQSQEIPKTETEENEFV
jgi:hypothetical protein